MNMQNHNIDTIIFVGFLVMYFLANFFYSTKPTSIDDYNHPNRKFSAIKIATTSVSMWIGFGMLLYTITETYSKGLYMAIPSLFVPLSFLFIAKFLSPRISEFLGKYSAAQVTRELWGNKVAFITSVSFILFNLVILSIKFKFATEVLKIFLNISHNTGIVLSATLIITYSVLGRIKVHIFSDIVQFSMFSCILPISLLMVWNGLSSTEIVWKSLSSNPQFDLKHVFNFHTPDFYHMLGLCIIASIPKFGNLVFPNISMSHSPQQSAQGFKIAGFIFIILQLVMIFLAIVLFSENPNLNPDDIFKYCINNYTYTGLKGFICVCMIIIALCISDFLLLSSSATLARDILGPMKFQIAQNELLIFRIMSIISGLISSYIALNTTKDFMLLIGAASIFTTLVSPPLFLAIFGFRSSELTVLTGMFGAIIVMIVYQWKFAIQGLNLFIPGILTNVILLLSSHYLLKQTGGWLGIKGKREFDEFKQSERRQIQKFIYDTFDVSFMNFANKACQTLQQIFLFLEFLVLYLFF